MTNSNHSGDSGNEDQAERDLRQLRREYLSKPLDRSDLHASPIEQFAHWLEDVKRIHHDDATSMVLATADIHARPTARIVLLKHFSDKGFAWYTNGNSEKGQHLAANPQAQLQFYWRELNRQIRISGSVNVLPRESAEEYFYNRPVGSQLSAWLSRQTQSVPSRQFLESAVEEAKQKFGDTIPCPDDWVGYSLVPDSFEFWQGRENRLHDRFQYTVAGNGWQIERLAP